jgi:hypothetical protein
MRFTTRDHEILTVIYNFDGVLAQRQLEEIFWPEKSLRVVQKRLSKLHQLAYIEWANRHSPKPASEPIYWLSWRGIIDVAAQAGIEITEPKEATENRLRTLEGELRGKGIHWVRQPHWQQLEHDLGVNDFRIAVGKSSLIRSPLYLEAWIPEHVFRSEVDSVTFRFITRTGREGTEERGVIPDGAFIIAGNNVRVGFFLELDMANHTNAKFATRKIAAGAAYALKRAYESKMDVETAFWLVVTTGEVRLKHLMSVAQRVAGIHADLFFYTTLSQARDVDPLTSAIWFQVGHLHPRPLFGR